MKFVPIAAALVGASGQSVCADADLRGSVALRVGVHTIDIDKDDGAPKASGAISRWRQ